MQPGAAQPSEVVAESADMLTGQRLPGGTIKGERGKLLMMLGVDSGEIESFSRPCGAVFAADSEIDRANRFRVRLP